MSAWEEYLSGVYISPGDIVEEMPGGGRLPVVLDLSEPPPAGYKTGTYRCLNCGRDPYDQDCCRQRALGRPSRQEQYFTEIAARQEWEFAQRKARREANERYR